MDLGESSRFPHRLNRDGSFDSICAVCLVTVASVREEVELVRHEQDHACDPNRVSQLSRYPHLSRSLDFQS